MITEQITWHPAENKPDSDLTVLCWGREGFFCGYWDDGIGCWIGCESGGTVLGVTHWAEPSGPADVVEPIDDAFDTLPDRGFLYLLERSAELLERAAEEIRISYTISDRWPQDDDGSKSDFDELREMANGLRKAHKYHKPNCLGGPANMFDAIADRMRAGETMKKCMDDYGLALLDTPPVKELA